MKNQRKRNKQKRELLRTKRILLVLLLLGIFFYLSGGLGVYSNQKAEQGELELSKDRLLQMEQRSLPELQVVESEEAEQVSAELDLEELRSRLLSHYGEYDYNSEYFRSWFSDSAIVGDSIAEAIKGFEWVNDYNVQSQVGISLYSCEEVIQGTEWLQPSNIFLTFSANDMAAYTEYIGTFISDYSDLIRRLQSSVPGARIFVQGILPCDSSFLEEYWYYQYLDEYNSRMEQMCRELGVTYYNVNFILDSDPDIFAEDGIHPHWPFYPLWLTYMAEVAGLAEY